MHRKSNAWMATSGHGGSSQPEPSSDPPGKPPANSPPPLRIFSEENGNDPPPCVQQNAGQLELPLFPDAPLDLAAFFETVVLPKCLIYADPRTIRQYRETLRFWAKFTGNPDVNQISDEHTIKFVEGLKTLPGRSRKPNTIKSNTIRKHCVHLQMVLDRLAPRSRANPYGAGILAEAPLIPKPSLVIHRRIGNFMLDEIGKLSDGCAIATAPTLSGVTASNWWRDLVTVAYNTGLRIETLLKLEFAWLEHNDLGWWFNVPPDALKKPVGREFYVNRPALAAVERMRAAGSPLVFPWPHHESWLHRLRKRIVAHAGVAEPRRFGFHGLRRACNTELTKINAAAAKMALGHSGGDVTIDYYTALSVMAEAMEKLPQPRPPQGRLFD